MLVCIVLADFVCLLCLVVWLGLADFVDLAFRICCFWFAVLLV